MKKLVLLMRKDSLSILNTVGINKYREDYMEKKVIFSILLVSFGLLTAYYLNGLYRTMFSITYKYEAISLAQKLAFGFLFLIDIYYLYECIKNEEYLLLNSFPLKSKCVVISKLAVLYICNCIIELVIFLPLIFISGLSLISIYILMLYIRVPITTIFICTIILYVFIRIGKKVKINAIIKSLLALLGISLLVILLTNNQVNLSYIYNIDNIVSGSKYDIQTYVICFAYIIIAEILSVNILATSISINLKKDNLTSKNELGYRHKKRTKFIALITDEFKRYLSNLPYVLNTALGLVLIVFFSINHYLKYLGTGLNLVGIQQGLISDNKYIFPYIMSLIIGTCSTTKVSLSIEGKCIWIRKMLPLKNTDIYLSKILVGILLIVPIAIISTIFLLLPEKTTAIDNLYIITILLLNNVFLILMGIFIDIKFVNYTWINPTAVIKRGASSITYQIINMLIMLTFIILIVKFKQTIFIRGVCILLTVLISSFMYKSIYNTNIPD